MFYEKYLILALVLALLLLPSVVSTFPDSVLTGPYKISFDIGLTRNDYNVTVLNPRTTEELNGDKEIDYVVEIRNRTAYQQGMIIRIEYFEKENPTINGSDYAQMKNYQYQKSSQVSGQASARTIDGVSGAAYKEWFIVFNATFLT